MPITHKAALLLVRLREPSFMVKAKYQFDIPANHLALRFKNIGEELESFIDENAKKIPVKSIKFPNLDYVKSFGKHRTFSTFNSEHLKYSTALYKIFDAAKDLDEFISIALYVRDEINTQLFVYTFYSIMSHRFYNVELPQPFEIQPQDFFKMDVLNKAKQSGNSSNRVSRQTDQTPEPIEVPFRLTMNVSNPEEAVTFFREDLGINSHHYHWHVVYPITQPKNYQDRRGEIFYYMHHQMVNIYHANRLTQRAAPVVAFDNFREIIEVGYFPEMTAASSSYTIPPRKDNMYLQDMRRDGEYTKVADLQRWHDRLLEAIDNGYFIDSSGNTISLLDDSGFNEFVNLLESNSLSKNPKYYGNLHNDGHTLISIIHDPTGKYTEPEACMGSTTTAVRDPIFFRWHQTIDEICLKLKDYLPFYTSDVLSFNGIEIKSLDLLNDSDEPLANDQLITYWQKSTVNLQNGLDFRADEPVLVQFTHLNYQHFSYSLKVNNTNAQPVTGTIRIFLVPTIDEKLQPYDFDDARKKAFELDRFIGQFAPGSNRVVRKSTESSLTISFDRTFPMQLNGDILLSDQPGYVQAVCMCGWPQHMLLPKGNADGYPFQIYVMISDYNVDKIDQPPANGVCNDNYVLCGLRQRKYPDSRAMGYPFDRASVNVRSFDKFLSQHKNMISKPITIRHVSENTAQIGDNPNDIVNL